MVGRSKEIRRLKELYNSGRAELVAVHGRRRVGKTFLINETFGNKFTFHHAGLSPVETENVKGGSPLRKQLHQFYNSLLRHGMKKSRCPDNWLDAFLMLEVFLESKDDGSRQLVFFDELPWMDTQRSGFITAFEGFWNTWACGRNNLMVIVCGSATSWITDKLINNHGGLYNRITYEIKLAPFSLKECEELFRERRIKLSRYDIVQAYMITGGIPYYLNYFEKGLSLAQNIDQLFFSPGAFLKHEYNRLFSSVFTNPEMLKSIVECLAAKSTGYSRDDISRLTGYSKGGTLSDALNALTVSDFIIRYTPFGTGKRNEHYKLVDPYCIFYNRFVSRKDSLTASFWQQNVFAQPVVSWRGLAFENVCFHHIEQIKAALGISGVITRQSAWFKKADDGSGTQIDLIIERKDHIANMCEIKFYNKEFASDKDYHMVLVNRQELLEKSLPRGMIVHSTLITTYGLKNNEYSGDFDNVITLEDLFR